MTDKTLELQQQIACAYNDKTELCIVGGNTKNFLGNGIADNKTSANIFSGEKLSTEGHSGIVSYDPSELVITARSGTALSEIKQTLADNQQVLAFEPPSYGEQATLGGTIACNLSGPARAYAGAARDFVLGCKLINGRAEVLQFGGQVIKNVAGYDASRLMTGAYGTLGLLLEVSLKVLPMAQSEKTIKINLRPEQAIKEINLLSGKNLAISASVYINDFLYIRISSSEKNTLADCEKIIAALDAQFIDDSKRFWASITEQQHDFFKTDKTLWRLSVPATCEYLNFDSAQAMEWGGACRWLKTDMDGALLRQQVMRLGGHATAFRKSANTNIESFQPLDKNMMGLQQRLKNAFDPVGILNPGRLYKAF